MHYDIEGVRVETDGLTVTVSAGRHIESEYVVEESHTLRASIGALPLYQRRNIEQSFAMRASAQLVSALRQARHDRVARDASWLDSVARTVERLYGTATRWVEASEHKP